MRRVRLVQKDKRDREDRSPVLPIDPRDQDVLRAKASNSETPRGKRL
ncbi:MAG: hypothetical protein ACRDHO_06765 [Actinomycetota bacterium]